MNSLQVDLDEVDGEIFLKYNSFLQQKQFLNVFDCFCLICLPLENCSRPLTRRLEVFM